MRNGYLKREDRKTILWLGDDVRAPSGIGTMTKELMEGMCHRYNFIQIGAAVSHAHGLDPVDLSDELSEFTGVKDAVLKVYPYNGYGDPEIVRKLINEYQPDGLVHFTDPRYWVWLYQMEHELRTQGIPIMFYTIWDDLPYPMYNSLYYRSSDWFGCISKQTYNIVKQVREKSGHPLEDWQLKYVPHGINPDKFFPIDFNDEQQAKDFLDLRKGLYTEEIMDDIEFCVLYNSRNIRRKMTSDICYAFAKFVADLPEEKRNNCRLVLHTDPIDENGTDLPTFIDQVIPEIQPLVIFSKDKIDFQTLNCLYNAADVLVNVSSNEGFGLTVAESLMAGTPVIVNVTGGLQDQIGQTDDEGNLLTENDFTYEWGSNHDGRYRNHGEWSFPVWPATRSLVGSPPTPYIFDDRIDVSDVADRLREVYDLGRVERKRRGLSGREFCLGEGGLNSENMCNLFMEGIQNTLENFEEPELWSVWKV
ncbi:MAG: glycosyltransferase family 4 protein [Betaproteobacteria bacterium]|jgi:glycosyltransferase involved in cell wall biosynthesis